MLAAKRIFTLLIFLVAANSAWTQASIFKTFQSDPALHLEVITHWDTLYAFTDDSEIDAVVIYNGEEWKSELQLRGRYRRMRCDTTILPFRMQFKRKELRNAGYEEFRNHKIVTQCIDDPAGLENLQEELLIYQLYEIITDYSFRSTEATLKMSWEDDRFKSREIPVLILEPNVELEARMQGVEIETFNYPSDSLDAQSYNKSAMFQFMVGNADWSQALLKNVKLIKIGNVTHVVPYDFDFAAVVSPPYARLPPDYGQKQFLDRVYLGQYFHDQLPETIKLFQDKKQSIYDHVSAFEGLKKSRRKQILKYFDEFYEFIEENGTSLRYKTVLFHKS